MLDHSNYIAEDLVAIKRWTYPDYTQEQIETLSNTTGLNKMVCAVLLSRGIDNPNEALRFVRETAVLDDPFLLRDMDKAAERISSAIEGGERIAVYGDYDCDGLTATALLTGYLQAVGADVIYYIPDRDKEGYGLNCAAINVLHEQKTTLIITVDNGISAHQEIAYAKSLGIDTVVTDHHTPRETLPDCVAVVNPHRVDCASAFKELAGVGVAFKLICALEDAPGEELLEHYSDIVALGTIADVVPLTGENRVMVRHGISRIPETDNPGIKALLEVCGLSGRKLTSEMVAFGLVPRINAAGRIGIADDVVELLLTDHYETAAQTALALNELNVQRKKIEEEILCEIEGMLRENPQILKERILIVSGENWHHGVVGIVSAKLVERYEKPCILFSIDNGEARGSGRSIKGISLIEAITACSEYLTRFGGHKMAAGLTLPSEKLSAFSSAIQMFMRENYKTMPLIELAADCALNAAELTLDTISGISQLEPFGACNEPPLFLLSPLSITGIHPTADKKHIRLHLSGQANSFFAIYFGMSADTFPFSVGDNVEVMAKISIGEYNGKPQLSVRICDIRPAGMNQQELLLGVEQYALYQLCELAPELYAELAPERDEVGVVYRFFKRYRTFYDDPDAIYFRLFERNIGYPQIMIALEILLEMGFVRRNSASSTIELVPDAQKSDLSNSQILNRLRAEALVTKQ